MKTNVKVKSIEKEKVEWLKTTGIWNRCEIIIDDTLIDSKTFEHIQRYVYIIQKEQDKLLYKLRWS